MENSTVSGQSTSNSQSETEEEGNEDTGESDAHVAHAEKTSPRVRRSTRNKREPVKFQLGEYITHSRLSHK